MYLDNPRLRRPASVTRLPAPRRPRSEVSIANDIRGRLGLPPLRQDGSLPRFSMDEPYAAVIAQRARRYARSHSLKHIREIEDGLCPPMLTPFGPNAASTVDHEIAALMHAVGEPVELRAAA